MTFINSLIEAAGGVPWPLLLTAGVVGCLLLAGAVWAAHRALTQAITTARSNGLRNTHLGLLVIAVAALLTTSYGVVSFFHHALDQPFPIAVAATVVLEGGMLAFKAARLQAVRHARPAPIVALYSAAGWFLVVFSVVVNIGHSLAFVAFPLGGAITVEIISRDLLAAQNEPAGTGGHAGPARIAAGLWKRGWNALAVRAGTLDTQDVTDVDARHRADRAAAAMYRLIQLEGREGKLAGLRHNRARKRATREIGRAGIGTDNRQGARMAARLHVLTSTTDLADAQLWRNPQDAARKVVEIASIPQRVEASEIDPDRPSIEGDTSNPYRSSIHPAGSKQIEPGSGSTPAGRAGHRPHQIDPGSTPDRGVPIEGASTLDRPGGIEADRPRIDPPRSGSSRTRSLDQLRAELAAAIEVGSIDRDNPSANQIRRQLACAPERARELRDELTGFGGVAPINGTAVN